MPPRPHQLVETQTVGGRNPDRSTPGAVPLQQLKLSPSKGLSVEMALRGQRTVRGEATSQQWRGEGKLQSPETISTILKIKSIGGTMRRDSGKHEVSRCSGNHIQASFMVQRAGEAQMARLGFPPLTSPCSRGETNPTINRVRKMR